MTRNSAQNRRLDVLRAIVTQYVATREPVGSKAIAAGGLGVSSATIRNDMAVLEEAGLIYQPHTSAGRVPTDRGYRVFVDRLAELKPMSGPERAALETFLSESVDIDDVVERSVRLLAQVTHQVALVQYPVARARLLKHLEVIDLAHDLSLKGVYAVDLGCKSLVQDRVGDVRPNVAHPKYADPRDTVHVRTSPLSCSGRALSHSLCKRLRSSSAVITDPHAIGLPRGAGCIKATAPYWR